MNERARARLERAIAEHRAHGDLQQAATVAVEGYGPEILGYLHALTRDPTEAADVFSVFCEDLWRGLPDFRGEASFRTWAYVLARNAFIRGRRTPHRRHSLVPLSACPPLSGAVERVRTRTALHLQTEVKAEVARLRDQLSEAERDLLVLRVDRGLSWQEIARVMSESADPSPAELRREAARLRKRYERCKDRLRKLIEDRRVSMSQTRGPASDGS